MLGPGLKVLKFEGQSATLQLQGEATCMVPFGGLDCSGFEVHGMCAGPCTPCTNPDVGHIGCIVRRHCEAAVMWATRVPCRVPDMDFGSFC